MKKKEICLITGIRRSGTSLLCKLINEHMPDAYAVNEIFYSPETHKQDLLTVRKKLLNKEPVPNKFKTGTKELTDNTGYAYIVDVEVPGKQFQDPVVFHKLTVPYMKNIGYYLNKGFCFVALIRDPVYTIASWLTPKCQTQEQNQIMPDDLHPAWYDVPFTGKTKIERMFDLWYFYFQKYKMMAENKQVLPITYEHLVICPTQTLKIIASFVGLNPNDIPNIKPMKSQNYDKKYLQEDVDIKTIKRIIMEGNRYEEWKAYHTKLDQLCQKIMPE